MIPTSAGTGGVPRVPNLGVDIPRACAGATARRRPRGSTTRTRSSRATRGAKEKPCSPTPDADGIPRPGGGRAPPYMHVAPHTSSSTIVSRAAWTTTGVRGRLLLIPPPRSTCPHSPWRRLQTSPSSASSGPRSKQAARENRRLRLSRLLVPRALAVHESQTIHVGHAFLGCDRTANHVQRHGAAGGSI